MVAVQVLAELEEIIELKKFAIQLHRSALHAEACCTDACLVRGYVSLRNRLDAPTCVQI
jgi:hypothetical protein